jgi:hypothetical protein
MQAEMGTMRKQPFCTCILVSVVLAAVSLSAYSDEIHRSRASTNVIALSKQKVFASNFGCGHLTVGYTNVNYNYNSVAVYAGKSAAESNSLLARVKPQADFQGPMSEKCRL